MVAVGARSNVQVTYIGVLARANANKEEESVVKVPGASATKLYYVLCIPHKMPSVDIIKILHSLLVGRLICFTGYPAM